MGPKDKKRIGSAQHSIAAPTRWTYVRSLALTRSASVSHTATTSDQARNSVRGSAPERRTRHESSAASSALGLVSGGLRADHYAILDLQHAAGNQAVAGQLDPLPTQARVAPLPSRSKRRILARQPEPHGGEAGRGGGATQIALPPIPLGKKKCGFFDVEAELSGGYSIEARSGEKGGAEPGAPSPATAAPAAGTPGPSEPSDSYDRKHAEKPAESGVKGKVGAGPEGVNEAGVSVEVKKELETLGFKPTLKGGVDVSTKTIKVGAGIEFEGEWGAAKATYAPLEFTIADWPAGKEPHFLVASTSVGLDFPPKTFPVDGETYSVKPQLKLELKAEPDKAEVVKWIGEHAAEMLTAEFAVVAGIIAAGAATIGVALYQIAHAGEFTERTEPEIKKCRAYCTGYVNAIRGQAAPPSEGGAEGFAQGQAKLAELKGRYPEGAVAEAARNANLYQEAWGQFWPPVKQRLINSYWDEHYVEKWIYGEEGAGSGGFKTFKMLLDGWDRG
jgi:hypothetical protein